MDDDQQSTPRSDFDARLAAARRAIQPVAQDARRGSAMGVAIRLSTDLVAAVAVGGFLGWLLDRWLGTSPWLLLLFFFLGVAAGIMNVVRTANQMNAAAAAEADRETVDKSASGLKK